MNKSSTIVGLDVHKNSITASVLPPNMARPREVLTIENEREAIARFVKRVTAHHHPATFVYEAGPCGYEVQRQIKALQCSAVVVAPALIPVRPGDRVKTNRRDAEKLARLYRAGELTEIRVPTRYEEAARDLVRAREDALADRLRARHRLNKFLLRQGRVFQETKAWGVRHRQWVRAQRFDLPLLQQTFAAYLRALEEAEDRLASLEQQVLELAHTTPYQKPVQYLRCLKGIDTLSALTILVETQDFRRFPDAPAYMMFTGLVSSESSSGDRIRRGPITKAGNAHLRRALVEASWAYRGRNVTGPTISGRRRGCPTTVVQIARRAQDRLHRKFWRLTSRGKLSQVATVAVARELAGFIWAIAHEFSTATAA
jgi:transposase